MVAQARVLSIWEVKAGKCQIRTKPEFIPQDPRNRKKEGRGEGKERGGGKEGGRRWAARKEEREGRRRGKKEGKLSPNASTGI